MRHKKVTVSDSSSQTLDTLAAHAATYTIDVRQYYDATFTKMLWEILITLLGANPQEAMALANVFLLAAHLDVMAMGAKAVQGTELPSGAVDAILDEMGKVSLNVSRTYKESLQKPLLNRLIKQVIIDMTKRELLGGTGHGTTPQT